MPASDYFTVTGGSYTGYNEQPEYISFQLDVSGTITFKQNLTTYFTVIGGGGGGGGSGGIVPPSGDDRSAGAGGGAGASGKISFFTVNNVPYSYEVGTGGAGSIGTSDGVNGTNSSITFSGGENIFAYGGNFGEGRLSGGAGGTGGLLVITGLDTIISGTSGDGGNGYIWPGAPQPAEDGTDQNPTSIEIYPSISTPVGGGGAGGSASFDAPAFEDGRGGGGGVGSGGLRYQSSNASGNSGVAYGGGGGGCGYTNQSPSTFSGGAGYAGAIFVYIDLPPPPTPQPEPYRPGYINRPGPIQYCTSRFAKCNITKKTSFSSGNVTIQGTTNARRQSLIVNQSTYRHGAKLMFSNQVLNAYGRKAGGPGGFGAPPRNHF